MSWIKKLFQMFKNDDEEFEYIDEGDSYQAKESSREQNSGSKEVDAKIAYQYPNGKFRFPLIPDQDERIQRRERVRSRNENDPAVSKLPAERPNRFEWKDRTRAERNISATGISSEQIFEPESKERTRLDRNKQEVAMKNRQPFRPTEIPSPIYGFGRRSRSKEEIVEYELTGLEGLYRNKTVHDQNLKEEHSEVQNVSTHSEHEEMNDKRLHSPGMSDNTYTERDEKAESTHSSAYSHDNQTEPTLNYKENESNTDEKSVLFDANEIQHVEDITEDDKTKTSGQIDHNQEDDVIENEPPIMSSAQEKEPIVQDLPPESSEQAAVPERRRPHIPFNVIMLKDDKRKLQLREQAKREQKERSANHNQSFPQKSQEIEHYQSQQQENISTIGSDQKNSYELPPVSLLCPPVAGSSNTGWLLEQKHLLNQTLENFNVGAKVVNVTQGPSVTRFEVQPDPGVKVNKITNLSDDIKLSLAARDIRIEAPIPGKHTIGIEVPNETSRPVLISEIIQSREFIENDSPLTAVLGLDISGKPIVTDLKKMPHGLIAGATGSGKSVCINSILISLLYKANPQDVKLLLIDPKMVELAPYNQIPHLVSPVITDVKAATAALKWAVDEMERRYELFAHTGVRDINRFNELAIEDKRYSEKLPYIVIVIDELADLMMMSPADVEEAICRIAQKARACGIHLIIATQRPSVDVITGLIKANVPTRIAFSVSSQIDSRTIIDISGAEKLLGRGDMLFLENGSSKPVRLQGTFVSDKEIDAVVAHVRKQQKPQYLFEQGELLKKAQVDEEEDELFFEACEFVIEQGAASTSSLQRRFKIGYNRAARLIDMMEQQGFISEARGSKPRDVLITESDLQSIQDLVQ
ncbi:DNA translocase FtsK [Bacillus methanolicus]|uniref:DNA translocase FtsK n=1 Tax=Bacillus methanolicus TaxID=1471 RepID=UPI0023806AF8|nr:DNA translocase FtsK [Bacillus methanolicus]